MSDLISRDDAIDAFYHIKCNLQLMDDTYTADKIMRGLRLAENAIELLPSAQKNGEWVTDDGYYFSCSICGSSPWRCVDDVYKYNYCPRCGAKMKICSR